MSYGGADRGGKLGGKLGTFVGFLIWIYYIRYMDVLVAKLGTWEG